MELESIILNAVMTGLTASIVGLVVFKISYKQAKKDLIQTIFDKDTLHSALQLLVNDEKLQRFCYEVGGLFAAGAGQGLGLSGSKGGAKLDLKSVALQLVASYLTAGRTANPAPNANPPPTTALNPQSNKVGYEAT